MDNEGDEIGRIVCNRAMFINDGQPFRSRDARDFGFTPSSLRQARINHLVRQLFRGVWVDNHVPDSRRIRIEGIKLIAPPYAVAADRTAAWIYGVSAAPPAERHLLVPKLVVPHASGRLFPDASSCRQAKLPRSDIVEIDGLQVTTPVRTTVDFLRQLWRPYALGAADAMAHAGLIRTEEVDEYLRRLAGYRGIRQARSLAPLIEPLAQSHGESWQRLRMLDAGFGPPTPQYEVFDEEGNARYFDHAYPELLIAVEYDGREFHTARADRDHDWARRSYFERRYGWRFVIAGKERIFGSDPAFEIELGQLYGRKPYLPRSW